MEQNKTIQCEQVLNHIRERGRITDVEAFTRFKIRRLSARIWDIRHKMGIDIKDSWEYKYDNKGKVIEKYKAYFI